MNEEYSQGNDDNQYDDGEDQEAVDMEGEEIVQDVTQSDD